MACPSFCKEPDCTKSYGAHLSFHVAAAALPTRGGAVERKSAMEKRWEKDMPAYKSLRRQGLQPQGIDGCDRLAATAECSEQIETGLTHVKPRAFEVFHEETGRKATEPATP